MRDEQGSSLLLVLLVVPVVTALSGLLVLAATTEVLTAFHFQQALHVRYAARALADRLVSDLRREADWSSVLSGMSASSFSGDATTWRPDVGSAVDLAERGTALQIATEAEMARGADTPRWRLYGWGSLDRLVGPGVAPPMPVFLGAWVADDGEDGDGDPFADSNGVVMVRAEAFSRANARGAVTAIVARGGKGLEDIWRLSWKDEP